MYNWVMFNIDMSLMYNWVICISTTGHYCSVASNNPINLSLTWNYHKQISYIILKCKKYSIIQNTILIEVNVVFYYLGSLWSLPVFGGVHVVFDWSGCFQGLLYSTLCLIRVAVFDWSGCIQGLLYSTLCLIRVAVFDWSGFIQGLLYSTLCLILRGAVLLLCNLTVTYFTLIIIQIHVQEPINPAT